ncbi:MAG: Trk system potassium transporter TrkA [Bacteroidales bacterium]
MRIVIAGAGEVGTHLARLLSNDDHNIIVLDEEPENLKKVSASMDLLCVEGSPQSLIDLKRADVQKADLFIGVTPYEERNILACMLAKQLGATRTIGRISSQEYLSGSNRELFRSMGVDVLILPESLAAKEISVSIKNVGTRQMIEFSGSNLILLGIKIRDNAKIVNKTMNALHAMDENILCVAISRGHDTIIPTGKDIIQSGDIAFFMTTKDNELRVFEIAGKTIFDIKNIMFIGGSRIAQKAIERLGSHFNITVIEQDKERCVKLAERLDTDVLVINGDGRDLELLKEEGIHEMDAIVAVTGNSETNILCCSMAKNFGVKRTCAEIENIDFLSIAQSIGIGSIINKKKISAGYIYKFTLDAEVIHVRYLTSTNAEIFEFIAKEKAKITSKKVRDISLPVGAIIGAVIRGNTSFLVNGDSQILAGDKVVVFVKPESIKKVGKLFRAG